MEFAKEFGKKIWIVVGAIALIFGSVWSLFDWLENLILNYGIIRKVLIFTFILFFVLLWVDGSKWWKQRYKVKENVDLAAEKFGFRFNKIEKESIVQANSSAIFKRNFELEVVGSELEAIEHRAIVFGNNKMLTPSIDFSGSAEGSTISYRITQQSEKSVIFIIDFSPALKKGKKAQYSIKEEYGPGFFTMDKDSILDMIKCGIWLNDEPSEFDSSRIVYPTNKLIKKVILPKNYSVSGKEYWDVTIGDSGSIAVGEYNRIKKEEDKYFKSTYSEAGNKILELMIDSPEIGLSYWLKWIPPTKEEYEKFVKESKKE